MGLKRRWQRRVEELVELCGECGYKFRAGLVSYIQGWFTYFLNGFKGTPQDLCQTASLSSSSATILFRWSLVMEGCYDIRYADSSISHSSRPGSASYPL